MNGQNKRVRSKKWDSFDGFLFPLAPSMPEWQVLAVSATCVLIWIQTDFVVAVKLLPYAAALGQIIPSSSLHRALRHGAGLLQAGQTEEPTSPR